VSVPPPLPLPRRAGEIDAHVVQQICVAHDIRSVAHNSSTRTLIDGLVGVYPIVACYVEGCPKRPWFRLRRRRRSPWRCARCGSWWVTYEGPDNVGTQRWFWRRVEVGE
jgi:hypothetical protein